MRNIFRNFCVFTSIFLLNFISIFFIWIKRKFGDVSLENIFYHFNSFFDGNILLPDHHLEESLVYYVINLNFLCSDESLIREILKVLLIFILSLIILPMIAEPCTGGGI